MIENFDEVKRQLAELAQVINSYKSEAVQLRIVELVLGAASGGEPEQADAVATGNKRPKRPKKRKSATRVPVGEDPAEKQEKPIARKSGGARSGGRLGGKAALSRLLGEDYFSKPRTIGDIVRYCDTDLATKLKPSDLSGQLARYVRDGKLKRAKNAEGQYEYTNP